MNVTSPSLILISSILLTASVWWSAVLFSLQLRSYVVKDQRLHDLSRSTQASGHWAENFLPKPIAQDLLAALAFASSKKMQPSQWIARSCACSARCCAKCLTSACIRFTWASSSAWPFSAAALLITRRRGWSISSTRTGPCSTQSQSLQSFSSASRWPFA